MKKIFDKPCKATQDRFKNKNKKILKYEIVDLLYEKHDKIRKDDLIVLHQILNGV